MFPRSTIIVCTPPLQRLTRRFTYTFIILLKFGRAEELPRLARGGLRRSGKVLSRVSRVCVQHRAPKVDNFEYYLWIALFYAGIEERRARLSLVQLK